MINKKLPLFLGLTFGSIATITAVSIGYVLNMNIGSIFNYYANPTSDTPIGNLDSYKTLAKRDAEIIMAAGFQHVSPIKLAYSPSNLKTFKDIGFILMDEILSFGGDIPATASANTASASFRSDLGSFQTAISSAILLNKNQEYFIPENFDDNPSTPRRESFKWAGYGGATFSSVTSFLGGFQQGIEFFNEIILPAYNKISTTTNKYLPIEHKTIDNNNFLNNNFGIGGGIEISDLYLNPKTPGVKGVDLFFPVAGPQISDALSSIRKFNNLKTILIGADSAVENDININLPLKGGSHVGNGKVIQMSSLKRLDVVGKKILEIIQNGNIAPKVIDKDGNDITNVYYQELIDENGIGGFGTHSVGNLENGSVGVSKAGDQYLQEALAIPGVINAYNEKINFLSTPAGMTYVATEKGVTKTFKYGSDSDFPLIQNFVPYSLEATMPVMNKKNFIIKNNEAYNQKILVALSTTTTLLKDASFSQSTYEGVFEFLKSLGINIPEI